jgi:hypothetical protein
LQLKITNLMSLPDTQTAPGPAREPVAGLILGNRAPAWRHVAEALGPKWTLG